MKLFSDYIIFEKQNLFTEKIKPIVIQLIQISYLNDIIHQINNKKLTSAYNNILQHCFDLIDIIKNKNVNREDIFKQTDYNEILKQISVRKEDTYNAFIELYKSDEFDKKIKNFISELDKFKTKNESLNESENNNIDKLKSELEKIKDVQFDDEDNNFYKIGQRLISNYEAFKKTMSDEDKQKLDTKIDKLIDDINKLSNNQSSNDSSDDNNNQTKEVEQTETKVIESKYIEGLKKGILELEKIEDDSLFKVFKKYVPDEAKDKPDGKEYLGLTILTLGAILLKKQDEHNWTTQILDITKKG